MNNVQWVDVNRLARDSFRTYPWDKALEELASRVHRTGKFRLVSGKQGMLRFHKDQDHILEETAIINRFDKGCSFVDAYCNRNSCPCMEAK